ncbi:MAG TPA: AmmeMemoRadiSam system protein A [Terriglobales bacterium]|jgi:AmmeMemoRadiSam system protein A
MSPSSEKSSSECIAAREISNEYSAQERTQLLQLAHASIASVFTREEFPREPPSAHFAEHRGVFTTLYSRGELRGCVGYVMPIVSLYRSVIETSRAAAFDDPRFAPLLAQELPALKVSLSILSPLAPIQPAQVEIGHHGLLITLGDRHGLLLPQVPLEHGWDRTEFLAQTCRKAGLPRDAWLTGATLEAFSAEIFGEN